MASKGDLEVGEECLQNLASKISREWKAVGRRLGLDEDDFNKLARESHHEGHGDVCYGMLLTWRSKGKKRRKYRILADALEKAGRTDLAEDLLAGKFDGDTDKIHLRDEEDEVTEYENRKRLRSDDRKTGKAFGASTDNTSRDYGNSSARASFETTGLSDKPTQKAAPPSAVTLRRYKMGNKQRGNCLILTYDEFRGNKNTPRPGNEVDEENLETTFKNLGFRVKSYRNLDKEDSMHFIKKMTKEESDSFVLFVCSHGNEESFITADNEEIALQEVITLFHVDKCPGFGGKPKMFFFNSCRGSQDDQLAKVRDSGPDSVKRGIGSNLSYYRPNQADFCVVLSTVSGYTSFRYMDITKGSYFVRNFTTTLKENYKKHHLIDILTMSNDTLLEEFEEERKSSPKPDLVCQVPTIISTLSKAVYLDK